jgi:biopolymer transport protein ExbD
MSAVFARTEETPIADINTTPLVDVMLVLLIMLLLSLPIATQQTTLDIGKGPVPAAPRQAVTVDIDFDGSIYWDGTPVESFAKLENYFRSIAHEPNQPDVRINAHRRVRYDSVAQVLAMAQRNGIAHLGFIGQERFVE